MKKRTKHYGSKHSATKLPVRGKGLMSKTLSKFRKQMKVPRI